MLPSPAQLAAEVDPDPEGGGPPFPLQVLAPPVRDGVQLLTRAFAPNVAVDFHPLAGTVGFTVRRGFDPRDLAVTREELPTLREKVLDVTGDGYPELVATYIGSRVNGNRRYGHFSRPSTAPPSTAEFAFGVLDVAPWQPGDPLPSPGQGPTQGCIPDRTGNSTYCTAGNGVPITEPHRATWQTHYGDVTGDGIADVVYFYRGLMGEHLLFQAGSPGGLGPLVEVQSRPAARSTDPHARADGDYRQILWQSALGDLNGDGIMDLAIAYFGDHPRDAGLRLELALGGPAGLRAPVVVHSDAATRTRSMYAARWRVAAPVALRLLDLNGDGQLDPLIHNAEIPDPTLGIPPAETALWYWLSKPTPPDLLRSVTTPLGGVVAVTYEASNRHEKARLSAAGETAAPPDCDATGCTVYDAQPHSVVATLRQTNGFAASDVRSVIRDRTYHYSAPRRRLGHFTANGALGYAVRRVDDLWTGTSTETRYRQHVEGSRPEQVTERHGADLRRIVHHAWDRLTPHAGTFAWVPGTRTEASFVTPGADPAAPFSRTTTTYGYRTTPTASRAHYASLAPESTITETNGQRATVDRTFFSDTDLPGTGTTPALYVLERVDGTVRYLRDVADPTGGRRLVLDAHRYLHQGRRYLGRDVPVLVRHERLRHGDADRAFCVEPGATLAGLRDTCDSGDDDSGAWLVVESAHRYDGFGHLVSWDNSLGGTTSRSYEDNLGRHAFVASTTDPAGNTMAHTYEAGGRVVTSTDPNGEVTTWQYSSAHGRLERVIPPGTAPSGSTSYEYLGWGAPPAQRVVTTHHDSATTSYRVERYLDGDAAAWQTVTHRADQPVVVLAERGQVMGGQGVAGTFARQSAPVTFTPPLDREGLEWQTTVADGFGRETFAGRIRRAGSRQVTLDPGGMPREVEKRTSSTAYGLDGQGRLQVTVTDANGSRSSSHTDPLGFLREVVDPAGSVLAYAYGPSGALTAIAMPPDASGRSRAMGVRPDSWGNVREITDPDLGTLRHEYDAAGNRTRSEDALGRVTVLAYDPMGRPRTETRSPAPLPGSWEVAAIAYRYDGAPATLPGGVPLAGRIGRLSGLTLYGAGTGSPELYEETYGYDERGNPAAVVKTYRGAPHPAVAMPAPQLFGYQHDWQGRMLAKVLPDGTKLAWTYQPDGLLAGASVNGRPVASGFAYNPRGQVTARRNPALGITETYDYTPGDSWLRSRLARDAQQRALLDYWYDYDATGNVRSIIDSHSPGAGNVDTQLFTYDELNRLGTASGVAYGQLSYRFDAYGNFTEKEGTFYGYGPCAGGLECVRGTTAPAPPGGVPGGGILLWEERRDAVGNRIAFTDLGGRAAAWTYDYDHANRLTRVLRDGAEVGRYGYGATGQRMWKLVTSAAGHPLVTYSLDRDYELRGEPQGAAFATTARLGNDVSLHGGAVLSTQPARADVYANQGRAIAGSTRDGVPVGTWFHLGNHLGSTSVTLGEGGPGTAGADVSLPATRLVYSPYGSVVYPNATHPQASEGYDLEPRKYIGEELDPESGLYYLNARHYDPRTGRFLTADTFTPGGGFSLQGLNRYAYARNNPFRYVDPSGHEEAQAGGAGSRCYSGSANSPGGAVCVDYDANRAALEDIRAGRFGGVVEFSEEEAMEISTLVEFSEQEAAEVSTIVAFGEGEGMEISGTYAQELERKLAEAEARIEELEGAVDELAATELPPDGSAPPADLGLVPYLELSPGSAEIPLFTVPVVAQFVLRADQDVKVTPEGVRFARVAVVAKTPIGEARAGVEVNQSFFRTLEKANLPKRSEVW
jgi:RHS repeat-associated protein